MKKPGFRILFLLYFSPPAPGTAPKRNFRIASYLADLAERAILMTALYHGKKPLHRPGMDVHEVKTRDYRSLLRRTTRDGYLPEQRKQSSLMQLGIKLINTFPFSILIGEGGFFYFLSLLRNGQRYIREEKITHIYSSFRPFADHYAAYCLKKWNPHLIWIADFRDLLIDPYTKHIFMPGVHQVFFKKLFCEANVVTTVSDGLASHLTAYHDHVITLRNGVNDAAPEPIPQPTSHFTVTYTGSMFLHHRNPQPLFAAVKELIETESILAEHIRIRYAGKDGMIWEAHAKQYVLEHCFQNKGIVTDDEAIRMQQESCVNLLLTISSPELRGYLTGKMIEYIEAGSPILAILTGQIDLEIESMLSELQIGQSYSDEPGDLEGIKTFILREYMLWKESGANRKPVQMKMVREKYSTTSTMRPLLHTLGIA